MAVSLGAVSSIGVGAVLVYSGIANKGVLTTIRDTVQGSAPAKILDTTSVDPHGAAADSTGPPSGPVSGGGGGSPSMNRATGRLLAAGYGWTGQEWTDLDNLWTRESGWQSNIMNPSGAFGIAQALGHGTPGAVAHNVHVIISEGVGPRVQDVNQYPTQSANAGSAISQIRWGLNYIRDTYGSPSQAWAHELANSWY